MEPPQIINVLCPRLRLPLVVSYYVLLLIGGVILWQMASVMPLIRIYLVALVAVFLASEIYLRWRIKPGLHIPMAIGVNNGVFELHNERGLYAQVPFSEITQVVNERPRGVMGWIIGSNSGEVTRISTTGAVGDFYVTPIINDYPDFLAFLTETFHLPAPSPRQVFSANRNALNTLAAVLVFGLAFCLVAIFSLSHTLTERALISGVTLWVLIAGGFFLHLSPLNIAIRPDEIIIRFPLRTLRIGREEFRGLSPEKGKIGGAPYRTLFSSKGKVYLYRSRLNDYDQLVSALESFSGSLGK